MLYDNAKKLTKNQILKAMEIYDEYPYIPFYWLVKNFSLNDYDKWGKDAIDFMFKYGHGRIDMGQTIDSLYGSDEAKFIEKHMLRYLNCKREGYAINTNLDFDFDFLPMFMSERNFKAALEERPIWRKVRREFKKYLKDVDTNNCNKVYARRQAERFGRRAFKLAGDIQQEYNWPTGGNKMQALHGLIGGIIADMCDEDFAAGVKLGEFNKVFVSNLMQNKETLGLSLKEIINLAKYIGGYIGKALGMDSDLGELIAESAAKYNEARHYLASIAKFPQEVQHIKNLLPDELTLLNKSFYNFTDEEAEYLMQKLQSKNYELLNISLQDQELTRGKDGKAYMDAYEEFLKNKQYEEQKNIVSMVANNDKDKNALNESNLNAKINKEDELLKVKPDANDSGNKNENFMTGGSISSVSDKYKKEEEKIADKLGTNIFQSAGKYFQPKLTAMQAGNRKKWNKLPGGFDYDENAEYDENALTKKIMDGSGLTDTPKNFQEFETRLKNKLGGNAFQFGKMCVENAEFYILEGSAQAPVPLPDWVKKHLSFGGSVIYSKTLNEFFVAGGGSFGKNKLSTSWAATVTFVPLSDKIKDELAPLNENRKREEIRKLITDVSFSASVVGGLGGKVMRTIDGKYLYGVSAGWDLSVTVDGSYTADNIMQEKAKSKHNAIMEGEHAFD